MKLSSQQIRIGIASVIVLGTIGYLAFTGAAASKSYYVTVAEMQAMGDKAYKAGLSFLQFEVRVFSMFLTLEQFYV